MDFNEIFSTDNVLGVAIRNNAKESLRKSYGDISEDLRLITMKMHQEVIAELIEEEEVRTHGNK